jgi:hypothetical protein
VVEPEPGGAPAGCFAEPPQLDANTNSAAASAGSRV